MTEPQLTAGPAPAPQVWPTLQAHDALALIDFYVETFGFLRTAVYADGADRRPRPARLAGGRRHHARQPQAGRASGPPSPGTLAAYAVTDHVEELWRRVRARAGSDASPDRWPRTDYGSREFAVRDPEGNQWSFGTYRGEPRP